MSNSFQDYLCAQLEEIDAAALKRVLQRIDPAQGVQIEIDSHVLLNFSSNNYLGLADHQALKKASIEAVETYGSGLGSARLISGSSTVIHQLEAALAGFKRTESALSFSSGYAAALGTVTALVGEGDVVVVDKLGHSCLIDAARLSRAKLRVFKHNDLEDLERILKWAAETSRNTLVITESVFSMDGDIAPLDKIIKLKEIYGAWLMVDEAHATGLYGVGGRGIVEEFTAADRVEIQMGTLGKALGVAGGFICGSQMLVDLLVNRARSFIYSTAPVPAQAAAACRAIELVQSNEGNMLRGRLWENVDRLKKGLVKLGWKLSVERSAILPIVVGAEDDAMTLSKRLRGKGIWVPAVRFPTVPRGEARLRITVSAVHSSDDIGKFLENLGHA